MISWAVSDGREHEGSRVVPAASTIKPIIASAFWRSGLDPTERVDVPEVPWSLADKLAAPTLGDCWRHAITRYCEIERLDELVPTPDWYPPSVYFQGMKFVVLGDPALRTGLTK